MSSDTVSDLRMTADGVATEIPPTTTAPSNTETELSQPEPGSPSKRSSKVGSPYKQLSRRFTSKKVIRVRKEKFSNDSVRGDGFMLFILNRVPHVAVLIIVTAMVAMAFVHAPAGNPRQDEAWTLRPIQWGETQNMWMPFYSFFAMLMTRSCASRSWPKFTVRTRSHRRTSPRPQPRVPSLFLRQFRRCKLRAGPRRNNRGGRQCSRH